MQPHHSRRARRRFSSEFKSTAVAQVLDHGKAMSEVARDFELALSVLREWVERERTNRRISARTRAPE